MFINKEDILILILLKAKADSDLRIRFITKTIIKLKSRGEVIYSFKLILEYRIHINTRLNIDL